MKLELAKLHHWRNPGIIQDRENHVQGTHLDCLVYINMFRDVIVRLVRFVKRRKTVRKMKTLQGHLLTFKNKPAKENKFGVLTAFIRLRETKEVEFGETKARR